MSEDWQQLLKRLQVADEEVFKTVERACRKRLGKKFTEEAFTEVCSEVYVRLLVKLAEDPLYFAFESVERFLGATYTTAWRVLGRGFRDIKRSRVDAWDPEWLSKVYSRSDEIEAKKWERLRELLANCDRVVEEYLSAANHEVREVFRLRCEGTKPNDVASKLGLTPTTAWRRWNDALDILRKKLRGTSPSDLSKE